MRQVEQAIRVEQLKEEWNAERVKLWQSSIQANNRLNQIRAQMASLDQEERELKCVLFNNEEKLKEVAAHYGLLIRGVQSLCIEKSKGETH